MSDRRKSLSMSDVDILRALNLKAKRASYGGRPWSLQYHDGETIHVPKTFEINGSKVPLSVCCFVTRKEAVSTLVDALSDKSMGRLR